MLKSSITSLAVLTALAAFPAQSLAATEVETYTTPGETPFVVPPGVHTIHIDAVGAPGGWTGVEDQGGPSAGAEVQGDLVVSPGDTLYLEIGVGGGAGGSFAGGFSGGNGGGESDVRTCSVAAVSCTVPGYGSATSAQTRLLVAGGGGGGGAQTDGHYGPGNGGNAGLLNAPASGGQNAPLEGGGAGGAGATATNPGAGGAALAGGTAGTNGDTGGIGTGGAGGPEAGGGGGGYHGGGGGGGAPDLDYAAGGGGGGSSWVNQDQNGIDLYQTHVTGASSNLASVAARIVISYTDAVGPTVGIQGPTTGEQVGFRPTFYGVGGTDPGDSDVTVSIYPGQTDAGSPVETATGGVDSQGNYRLTVPTSLPTGTYTASVSQTDIAGDTGSASVTFSVDAAAPAVTITQPASGSTNAEVPSFAGTLGTKPKDNQSVVLALYAGTGPTTFPFDTTTATVTGGQWTADPGVTLAPGTYTAIASQSDNGGNIGYSSATFTVTGSPTPPVTGNTAPTVAGNQSPADPQAASPQGQVGAAQAPSARTGAGLRVLVSRLRTVPRGCAAHPRPRHLTARACAPTALVSGSIARSAAGERLAINWEDGDGHAVHAAVRIGKTGRWAVPLNLPASARTRRGYVLVSYTGDATLLAASAQRAIGGPVN